MISDNRREAIEDARATVAFYTQSPHYNAYFDYIGFGQEARAIQEAHSRGDFAGMTAACPDEMVETIVLVGSADEVLKRQIGRASCRERVCQYVEIAVVAVTLKKKIT